jgi:hypothetical protein
VFENDSTSRPAGRRRLRLAVGSMVVALVVLVGSVLVGCSNTVDGQSSTGTSDSANTTSGSDGSESSSSSPGSALSADSSSSDSLSSDSSGSASTESGTPSPVPTASVTSTSASPATTSTTASSSTASSTGTTTSFSGNPGSLPLTEPGKQLKYGEAATVPISFADEDGVFTLSDLTVTQGSDSDWEALGVDSSDAQGQSPWYLKLTVKQEAGGDFTYSSVETDLWAYTAGGDNILPVFILDYDNSICPVTGADGEFNVGDSYTTCVVLSVNTGESIDRIQFEGDYDFDSPYYNDPVVWKAG